jgi:hypothetical protein
MRCPRTPRGRWGAGLAALLLATAAGCGSSSPPASTAENGPTSTGPNPYKLVPPERLLARPKPDIDLPDPIFQTEHGATYTAIYFAALDGPGGREGYEDYQIAAEELGRIDDLLKKNFGGKFFGDQVTNCDVGAEPALTAIGIASPVLYISLHFATPESAAAFVAGIEPQPLTTATVQTFCRD